MDKSFWACSLAISVTISLAFLTTLVELELSSYSPGLAFAAGMAGSLIALICGISIITLLDKP